VAFGIFVGAVSVAPRLDLDAAPATLPAQLRLCVVLAYSEAMSHAEISESTAMPLGTIKSHIARLFGHARAADMAKKCPRPAARR
jgi:DNA-directed RNA polymerase specialized sigma24 family protein